MKRLAFMAAVLVTVAGCDSETVREHIIDNFVCSYMPWWMGDCQGEETVSKVMGVLDHGLTAAYVECTLPEQVWTIDTGNIGDLGMGRQYLGARMGLLQDGATVSEVTQRGVSIVTRFSPRPGAHTVPFEAGGSGTCSWTLSAAIGSGLIELTLTGDTSGCPDIPSPQTFFSGDVSQYCTGFNLEAFE